jgi:hypothetical protein
LRALCSGALGRFVPAIRGRNGARELSTGEASDHVDDCTLPAVEGAGLYVSDIEVLPLTRDRIPACEHDIARHADTADERLGRRDITVMAGMEQATAVLIAETNGIGKPSWAPCRRAPDLNRGRTR